VVLADRGCGFMQVVMAGVVNASMQALNLVFDFPPMTAAPSSAPLHAA